MAKRVTALVVVGMLAVACSNEAELKAEINRRVFDLRAATRARDAERRRGLVEARGTVVPRPDLGRCPVSFPEPPDWGVGDRPEPTPRIEIVAADELATRAGAVATDVEWQLMRVGVLSGGFGFRSGGLPGILAGVRALARASARGHDVTVVADELRRPVPRPFQGYEPGSVVGRAFVWSYNDRRVVCAAHVSARSSSWLAYQTSDRSSIVDEHDAPAFDFERQVMRAVRPALVRAGPRR